MKKILLSVAAVLSAVTFISAQEITETPAVNDTAGTTEVKTVPDSASSPAPASVQKTFKEEVITEQSAAAEAPVQIQEENNETGNSYSKMTSFRYNRYIGFSGGFVTGYGVSYRRWFDNSWGLEFNLFPWYREYILENDNDDYYYSEHDSGYSKEGDLCLGITYLKNLAELNYLRILFYSGGNLQTSYRKWHHYDYTYDYNSEPFRYDQPIGITEDAGRTITNKVSAGLGAGAEWYVWRFAFHLMLGFYGSYIIETGGKEIMPSIEGGIHFRF